MHTGQSVTSMTTTIATGHSPCILLPSLVPSVSYRVSQSCLKGTSFWHWYYKIPNVFHSRLLKLLFLAAGSQQTWRERIPLQLSTYLVTWAQNIPHAPRLIKSLTKLAPNSYFLRPPTQPMVWSKSNPRSSLSLFWSLSSHAPEL